MSLILKKILEAKLVTNPLGNRFIQLMHPGGEPKISRARPSYCPPNTGKVHARKFLSSYGEYLGNHDQVQHGQLNFWGEWELGSHVWHIHHNPVLPGMPLYVHTPDCSRNTLDSAINNELIEANVSVGSNSKFCNSAINSCYHQSTDPFVFCNPFLYFHCRIRPNNQLNNLQKGDIVVFGSHLKGRFVLDTVFVVSGRVKLDDPRVCQKFLLVNKPFLSQFPRQVYLGATFADPVDGMFSFFPALPVNNKIPRPFARPIITLPNYINNNLMMGFKIKHTNNVGSLWFDLVCQVDFSGLSLGLKA